MEVYAAGLRAHCHAPLDVACPQVALKVSRTKPRGDPSRARKMLRLQRELSIWQKFKHPSVISLLAVVEVESGQEGVAGAVAVACELVPGGELFDMIDEVNALPEADIKLVMAQITSGIAHLHLQHNVAHRDIKSANVLCSHSRITEPGCIKLADFGFACARPPTVEHEDQPSPPSTLLTVPKHARFLSLSLSRTRTPSAHDAATVI